MSIIAGRLGGIRARLDGPARDVLLVVVLAVSGVAHLSTGVQRTVSASTLLWLAILLGPLIVRRKAPVAVLASLMALSTAAALGLPTGLGLVPGQLAPLAGAVLLVALATVAVHRPRVFGLIGAVVLGAWGPAVLLRWTPGEPGPTSVGLWCCAVVAAALAGMYTQMRRAYVGALRERAARLEYERDQQARMTAAEVRGRIARELHDVVSHNLAVIVALADGAAATAPDPAAGLMKQVASTGRHAIDEMRLILGLLRDDEAVSWRPQPGIAQLGDLIAETRATGLPARLVVTGKRRDLGPGLELTVYRIVQEALTNVRKHARGATRAQVRLDYQDELLEVEVADDGSAGARSGDVVGHGLTGMGERAAAFAGTLDAGPAAEGGWRVRVLLTAPDGRT
jgi:signal transduction histidine kinase